MVPSKSKMKIRRDTEEEQTNWKTSIESLCREKTSFLFLPFPFQSLELCYHLSLCVALTAVTVDNRVNDNKDWGLDDFLNDYNWNKKIKTNVDN